MHHRRSRLHVPFSITFLTAAMLAAVVMAQTGTPTAEPSVPAPASSTPASAAPAVTTPSPSPAPASTPAAPPAAGTPSPAPTSTPDAKPSEPAAKTSPAPAAAANPAPAPAAPAPKSEPALPDKKPVIPSPVPAPVKTDPVAKGPPQDGPFKGKVVVIPVGKEDLINPARFEFMSRTLKRATEQRAEAVIFNLDTPGGLAWDTATLIMQDLQKLGCPSAAYVNPRAISAGALIAIGTDSIYMSPSSSIGAATPINSGGQELGDAERAKMNSAFMAMARSAAMAKGHNPQVVDAMIDKDVGLKIGDVQIVPKGQIASFTQAEATAVYNGKPLLAKAIVNDLEALVKLEGYKGELVVAEPPGFELIAIWITQYAAILLLIGIAAGYIEMQSPGLGIPAIISAIAFGLFFFGHYIAGSLVGYETVVVFIIGVALIVVELFVFPGHIVPGLLGLLCLFGALIYTMAGWDITVPEGETFPVRFADYSRALFNIGIAFGGALVLILLLMRFFPTSGPFKWLVLKSTVGGEQAAIEGHGQSKASTISAGSAGVTRSAMRPYGHVDFDGLQLEAMVEGDYLAPGTQVKVRAVQGGKVIVERA